MGQKGILAIFEVLGFISLAVFQTPSGMDRPSTFVVAGMIALFSAVREERGS